ncbi:hypothetical protein O4G76_08985 [Limimaricola sp. G21655-S1]|uniref:hypothetical protein n=1 Tax=Limimaricola sp. G21655-S1 TaxID=3014768 RepID=UPI0022AF2F5D|nr:hypothetical protein [Limimaricola sp. G21655-S1]MCZ4260969.1 hypothetical protein [Limimaricola sp. G21655-S1]
MSDTLDALDALSRARSLCHLFGMTVSPDDLRDGEAISTLADIIDKELEEAQRLLRKQTAVQGGNAV